MRELPMIVWDRGVWAPMGDAEKDLESGAFKFRLAGEKLSGGWMLARLKPKAGERQRAWLFFKEWDQAADPETVMVIMGSGAGAAPPGCVSR